MSFILPEGVTLRGGYAGTGAGDPDDRDIVQHETRLSGDLLGNDTGEGATRSDNSFHVIRCEGAEQGVLDGLTIRAGTGDGGLVPLFEIGAGLGVADASVVIRDCTFVDALPPLHLSPQPDGHRQRRSRSGNRGRRGLLRLHLRPQPCKLEGRRGGHAVR